MTNTNPASLSNRDLVTETKRVAAVERQTTAALVALLAELDDRELYLAEGYSSLFGFCTRALHLSEQAAYARIEAARTTRRFPAVLTMLEEGAITLTTVGLLTPHLTEENHDALLGAARHKSKRDVEHLVAAIHPQPDIPSSVRAFPVINREAAVAATDFPRLTDEPVGMAAAAMLGRPRPSVVAPISPKRYLLRITVSEETHRNLERATLLLRHQIPSGDPAAIFERALTVLVEQVEKTKVAATAKAARRGPAPTAEHLPSSSHDRSRRSRRIPAAVRRAVWARDEGRCAFVGADGRCAETGFLEFHHVVPFAAHGLGTVENIQVRCRAHNAHEAALEWGPWPGRQATTTRSGPS